MLSSSWSAVRNFPNALLSYTFIRFTLCMVEVALRAYSIRCYLCDNHPDSQHGSGRKVLHSDARRQAANEGRRGNEGLLGLGKGGRCYFWLVSPEKREKRELSYSVFLVKNIKSAVSDLKAKGVKFQRAEKMTKETKIEGPIARDPTKAATAFFKDSEGNFLMLWEGT